MGKSSRAGVVMLAGGLLTAACASVAPPAPAIDLAGMASTPAPRSTLVSRPDLRFSVAHHVRESLDVTVLVHEPAPGTRVPVARVVASSSGGNELVSVQRLPWGGAHDRALDVAVIEHLYVLAVQQDGRARFCLAPAGEACDPAKSGESHAELLRELVDARERALQAAHDTRGIAWSVVAMTPVATPAAEVDRVGVRVTAHDRPFAGAHVIFSRAPHSGCMAQSDAQGLASCKLVDFHGDDDGEDEGKVPVVATFSGDVRADRTWVPTTALVPPREPQALAKGHE